MLTKLSNKGFFITILLIMGFFNNSLFSGDNGLAIGETVPNPEFLPIQKFADKPRTINLHEYKKDQILLVAIMPDLTENSNISNVITSAFDTYFSKRYAFTEVIFGYIADYPVKVLIVANNDRSDVTYYLEQQNFDFEITADINVDFAHSFGITGWKTGETASHVYVVNKENKIVYADYNYKGEGEKLKSVQKEIGSLLGIEEKHEISFDNYTALMPGDNARDFEYTIDGSTRRLSDLFGKRNVLIAFYPAPFSLSCMMETKRFDAFADNRVGPNKMQGNSIETDDDLEILMVSISNGEIINKWKDDMGFKNVKMVGDLSGEISAKYSSYNPLGYNNRTVFLIDKSGKVKYVDWDYIVDDYDYSLVMDQISALSK
ncbi:MAG: redoxin domain-containing protein [Ignavibacteria bacterium]|nr:redoxin domain-containing protein [Ignavibacteria bacterium]